MEYPPQTHDPMFMEEAAQAAARINAQAAGGNVYGAPRNVSEAEHNYYTSEPVAQDLGNVVVTGAARLDTGNYVDPSKRGELYAEYANHEYVAQQQVAAEIQQREAAEAVKADDRDDELVDA